MRGFDVNTFLGERRADWEELERLLSQVEREGLASLEIEGARRFGKLYRSVSSDLIRARTELVDASVVDYLNDLVARSYAQIHAGTGQRGRQILSFFVEGFPRLFRAEWKAIAMAALLLFAGGGVGAVAVAVDTDALGVLIPEQHQAWTPDERIARDTERGPHSGHAAAQFSSFLFTHNIKVSFLVFALGITFGVGTVSVLFYNGVPLGALAMQYHQAGQGPFFWAWILPHGIPELTSIFIAGGAGLVIARGLLLPGRRTRRDALVHEARRSARLVVGAMPILVVAGLIEGTISQIHAPVIPYTLKIVFALLVGAGLFAWLLLAGRRRGPEA
ncbi:MAG TPA: stage II sporulation protein M [Sandaracinaceae bacterium LLY-WYZ-13_1]|nr:stage II sporulation protein M [Sandaracinaceae bacterium LLY-WYZ-13_1]